MDTSTAEQLKNVAIPLQTLAIPFVVALLKKILHTDRWSENTRRLAHTLMPLVTGFLASGLTAASTGLDWKASVAIGFGSGAIAASTRDLAKAIQLFSKTDSPPAGGNPPAPDQK